jgi:hypothetical protein
MTTGGSSGNIPGDVAKVEGELDAASLEHAAKAAKLSPKALHLREHERFVASLERDRDLLRGQLQRATAELDDLRPKHAALEQHVASLSVSVVLGTILLGVGAALVSTAVYLPYLDERMTVGVGWGMIVGGAMMLIGGLKAARK